MKTELILAIASILPLAYFAFIAGRIYELRRQLKKIFEKELENMKLIEEVLWSHRFVASESATEKPEADTTAR